MGLQFNVVWRQARVRCPECGHEWVMRWLEVEGEAVKQAITTCGGCGRHVNPVWLEWQEK